MRPQANGVSRNRQTQNGNIGKPSLVAMFPTRKPLSRRADLLETQRLTAIHTDWMMPPARCVVENRPPFHRSLIDVRRVMSGGCGLKRPVKNISGARFTSQGKDDMSSGQRRLDIEEIGGVTVAKFVDKKILDETNIQNIGNQLFALVDEDGRKKIVLDFSIVEYLSSAALGKLITMDKKVKAAKSKLRLCCIRPEIYEVFEITRLNKIFDIKSTQEEALEGI